MPDTPLEEAREAMLDAMRHPWACIALHGEVQGHTECAPLNVLAAFEAAAKAEAVEPLETLIEHVRHEADMLIRHHDTLARDVRVRLHKQADIAEARRALSTSPEGVTPSSQS